MAVKENDMLVLVEERLQEWADWSRGSAGSIGYPSRSPIHRMMREGAGAGGGFGPRLLEMPATVQTTESALRDLPDRQRKALKLKYLSTGLRDQDRAKRLRISYEMYRREVERARWFLCGRIG